ncbi:MAG: class I SAM-dependent methyltransferase [Gemmatimonadota bacterium]
MSNGLERLADKLRADGGQPLDVVLPDGSRICFGLPPRVVMKVNDEATLASLATPTLSALGEAFVDGRIDVEGDFMDVISMAEKLASAGGAPVTKRMAAAANRHSPRQDRADIGFHYNVGNDFYRLWLDERMVYSCAYFPRGDETIDEAQIAKLDHICRKLRLAAGERLLDIGCGWGGLAIHAAQRFGVRATGITLSENQYSLARERVAQAQLSDRVEILLLDYRELIDRFGAGSFDKISSIGMFEHVGIRNLPQYFGIANRALRDRGLFLNHGITSSDIDNRPIGSGVGEFIEKYVFPHGELPHLHLAVREMSAQGFEVFDVESWRPHYARTLEHWSRRLESRLAEAAQAIDGRRMRIWRAYLAGCSHGFSQGWMNIYQVLASKQTAPGLTELPLSRKWIYD